MNDTSFGVPLIYAIQWTGQNIFNELGNFIKANIHAKIARITEIVRYTNFII